VIVLALEMDVSGAVVHCTVVLDDQDAVAHASTDRTALAVGSLVAKLSPVTVTIDPPLCAVFSVCFDANGASKLNVPTKVPPVAATVMVMKRAGSRPSGSEAPPRQLTEVEDDHEAVLHAECSKTTVAVSKVTPNWSPVTVTEACPDRGAFWLTSDTSGASKVNKVLAVPATAPTVTAIPSWSACCELPKHPTDVDDVHDAVMHGASDSPTLAVSPATPNDSPVTVTDACPLCGAFTCPYDTAGASNVTMRTPVPQMAATVTTAL
jgi:hypothetical protein